ncbi:hypothetical protein OU798_05065 [Prolixibacteraceae bacterium Z1-6]|uniref:Calcineurin-like phosphoesterase domain-containing protein n=1 Tax=Draconibacterium aestuarii TaxID=2998507 RepID=A0A9X3J6I8_9BACT|nr:hypothetical protein [Prolixibacteraceae bacterium Z1-6]
MKPYQKICFIVLINTLFFNCSDTKHTHGKDNLCETDSTIVAMFLSDFHVGENYGAVSRICPPRKEEEYDEIGENIFCHKKVIEMLDTLGTICKSKHHHTIPRLILLGDIFDIAVHEESDAFNLTHDFFNTKTGKYKRSFISYFDEVIYISGNHDHHVWKMLQENYYIEERLQQGNALPYPHQRIAVLDLNNLQISNENTTVIPLHGNMVSAILRDKNLKVHIAYPNLYIRCNTDDNAGICVTHGHFFEPNWNKSSNDIPNFPDTILLKNYFVNLEKYNSPFTEFSDYSIAQVNQDFAQGLSDACFDSVFYKYRAMGKYVADSFPAFFPLLHDSLKNVAMTAYDTTKLSLHKVQVIPYLEHVKSEMAEKNMKFTKLVYGHTHVPCFREDYVYGISDTTEVSNTGGWVNIAQSQDATNTYRKTPNPMFLTKDGGLHKVFDFQKKMN